MTFFVELPPIIERITDDNATKLLHVIADLQNKNIASTTHTLLRKMKASDNIVRPAVLALMNDGYIEPISSPYIDSNAGGADGRFGFKVLQKGWDKLGWKPVWMV